MAQEIEKINEARELAKYDFGEDEGVGVRGKDRDELQTPFLVLLQDLSPQVTGTKGAKVPGAEAGKLYNNVTEEVYGDSVEFIPAHSERVFVEWRANRGGLVRRHDKNSPFVADVIRRNEKTFGRLLVDPPKQKESNELVETFYVYGVLVLDGGARLEFVILALTSTKITPWKNWSTKANTCLVDSSSNRRSNPPIYAHRIRIGVGARDTKNGGSYFPIKIEPFLGGTKMKECIMQPDDPRYVTAKRFREMVLAGNVVMNEEAIAHVDHEEPTVEF